MLTGRSPDDAAPRPRLPAKWLTIALFLLPALVALPRVRPVPDRPGRALQPVQVERARGRSTDFVGLKNYQVALASNVFWTAVGNNVLIIVLLARSSRSRSRWRSPSCSIGASRAAPSSGCCSSCRTSCPRRSPASSSRLLLQPACARRLEPPAGRPGRPGPGLAGRPEHRDDHPVRHHLVEVLRLPHDPAARRAPGHPARDRGGRAHRRRRPLAGVPLRRRCRCSGRRCACRSSCR